MYAWEYLVRPSGVLKFKRIYGPKGKWARLFRKARGYVRTELHRDMGKPRRFITIDYWKSYQAWKRFRQKFASEFAELDLKCERMTTSEKEIGRFKPID